jgi:hypothetical protein
MTDAYNPLTFLGWGATGYPGDNSGGTFAPVKAITERFVNPQSAVNGDAGSDPNVVSETKRTETETTVGTETTTSTTSETEQTTVGGAVQDYLVRGAVIVLGMVFVAAGLRMFQGSPVASFRWK